MTKKREEGKNVPDLARRWPWLRLLTHALEHLGGDAGALADQTEHDLHAGRGRERDRERSVIARGGNDTTWRVREGKKK